ADAQAAEHRHAELLQPVADGLRGRPLAGRARCLIKLADRDSSDAIQGAHPEQLSEHPIVAVRRLAGVLEQEDGPVEAWNICRAQTGFEDREVAPEQATRGDARASAGDA